MPRKEWGDRRGGEKLLPGFQITQGDVDSKEIARIMVDCDQFPGSSQRIVKRADKFLIRDPSRIGYPHGLAVFFLYLGCHANAAS